MESVSHKRPLDFIEGFFQVYFCNQIARFTLHSLIMVYNFLDNACIVRSLSILEKLDWQGPISLGIRGLIQVAMGFVMIL